MEVSLSVTRYILCLSMINIFLLILEVAHCVSILLRFIFLLILELPLYMPSADISIAGPVVLVTDPPFGGMAELLANSLRALSERWRMTNDIGQN